MATLLTPKGKRRAIPTTMMKAAAIDEFGPGEVMRIYDVPIPEIEPHEVLIELYAAGVGVWDIAMRTGAWQPKGRRPQFPLILGLDGAGVVAAKGSRVRNVDVGDRVWSYDYANKKGGFYAEYAAVDHALVGPIPEHLSLLEAGAVPVTGLTALQGIDHLRLRKGDIVLIFGATGAVGTMAVQFAHLRGAHVVATASYLKGSRLIRKLGADDVIDARKDDVMDQLRQIAPDGIDAALALAGGEALERLLDLVSDGGRVAWPGGIDPEPRKRRKLDMMSYDGEAGPKQLAKLKQAAETIPIQVPIDRTYPLSQARKADEQLETSQVLGRIVLRIRREK